MCPASPTSSCFIRETQSDENQGTYVEFRRHSSTARTRKTEDTETSCWGSLHIWHRTATCWSLFDGLPPMASSLLVRDAALGRRSSEQASPSVDDVSSCLSSSRCLPVGSSQALFGTPGVTTGPQQSEALLRTYVVRKRKLRPTIRACCVTYKDSCAKLCHTRYARGGEQEMEACLLCYATSVPQ